MVKKNVHGSKILESLNMVRVAAQAPKNLEDYLKGYKWSKTNFVYQDGTYRTIYKVDTSQADIGDVMIEAGSDGFNVYIDGVKRELFPDVTGLTDYLSKKVFSSNRDELSESIDMENNSPLLDSFLSGDDFVMYMLNSISEGDFQVDVLEEETQDIYRERLEEVFWGYKSIDDFCKDIVELGKRMNPPQEFVFEYVLGKMYEFVYELGTDAPKMRRSVLDFISDFEGEKESDKGRIANLVFMMNEYNLASESLIKRYKESLSRVLSGYDGSKASLSKDLHIAYMAVGGDTKVTLDTIKESLKKLSKVLGV